jgi:hypothetical protein
MNIILWVLQALLAFHTAMGAVWKFSHSEQAVPSLKAIPHAVWLGLSGVELLCAVGLLLPAVMKNFGISAPVSAVIIAAEMLLFCGLYLASGETEHGQMIYWLGVAAFCAFIAYGRFTQE